MRRCAIRYRDGVSCAERIPVEGMRSGWRY